MRLPPQHPLPKEQAGTKAGEGRLNRDKLWYLRGEIAKT